MLRLPLLISAILALSAEVMPAQGLTPSQVAAIDSIFAPFDGTGRPGCAVGVGLNGSQVYSRGFGMADLQQGRVITPQSIFHVASVSKQFAALIVASLAEEGLFSLDDDVRKFVPELPANLPRYTVRQLIHHTSGVRDHWELLGYAGWRYPVDLFTNADVLEILSRQKGLNFNPGDEYLYSNGGYTLLAFVAERLTGKSLRVLSEERIFAPLGMTRTHVHDDHAMLVPGRTAAYQFTQGTWKTSIPSFDTHGATSLFTTVEDLLYWLENFESGTVLGGNLLAAAQQSGELNNGRSIGYGYGIVVGSYRGARTIGHGGSDAGYRADVLRFPDHRLNIAVTCNFSSAVPGNYTRRIADVVLVDKLSPAVPAPVSVTLSEESAAQLAGVYRYANTDIATRFHVRDARLVQGWGSFGNPVNAVNDRRIRVGGNEWVFVGPTTGAPVAIRIESAGVVVDSLVRVESFAPTGRDLDQYVGRYWSEELQVSFTIAKSDSGLTVKTFKHGTHPLTPLYPDAFQAPRAGTMRFMRSRGRITGFRITGGRVRNVEFTRASSSGAVNSLSNATVEIFRKQVSLQQ